jgi:Fe2+ transport system protein FeoA
MSDATDTDYFPLTFAANGETVSLAEIRANGKLRKRLGDLGLNIGMDVRIVQANACGPLILAVKNDSRLALGRGMAQKIMVKRNRGIT